MKKIFGILIILIMVLSGCGHKHEWVDATCTMPSICEKCGETMGEPLGHTTDLGICKNCNELQGTEECNKIFTKVTKSLKKLETIFTAGSNSLTMGYTEESIIGNVKAMQRSSASVLTEFKEAVDMCSDYEFLSDYKKSLKKIIDAFPTKEPQNLNDVIKISDDLAVVANMLSTMEVETEALISQTMETLK